MLGWKHASPEYQTTRFANSLSNLRRRVRRQRRTPREIQAQRPRSIPGFPHRRRRTGECRMNVALVDQVRAALRARNIIPPATLLGDGTLHRCDAEGKNGKGDAAYVLHLDGPPAGGFQNWRDALGREGGRARVE